MRRPPSPLALFGLALGAAAGAAAGAGAAQAATPGQVAAPARVLRLGALASLTNYRFTATASNGGARFALDGTVHGPQDWETQVTSPVKVTTYDVHGHGYAVALGRVEPVTFRTADGLTHLDGERTAAEGLVGFTHITGIRITTHGSCSVAGTAGTTYVLATPRSAAGLLLETVVACVANRSGALLSSTAGVPSGSAAAPLHLRGAVTTFRVDAIGGVPPILPPKVHPVPTVPTTPG